MLCLLGQPAVVDGGVTPLRLRPKCLALLAYLAITGREVPRGELARLLFPEATAPLNVLRWHLNQLRATAPQGVVEALAASRQSLRYGGPTDLVSFRVGAKAVLKDTATVDARQTLALYRGDLVTGLTVSASAEFETWLYVEQEGLRRLFRQATVAVAQRALRGDGPSGAVADVADAVEPLARLVTVDPYYEDGHILLIEAYEALGRPERARSAYERYQHAMRQELHVEPRRSMARRYETQPPDGPVLPTEDLVPLREVTLHVLEWPGDEPAVLAIHGSGGGAYHFATLAERLEPQRRLVALDLRGHGFSDKPPRGYDVEDHVGDVVELIEALALRRPVLLGFSAGGTVATFAATHTNVGGLILLEGMVGDRAFRENAVAQAAPLADLLDERYADLDAYIAAWYARAGKPPGTEGDAARVAERWARLVLVRNADGTFRRPALRSALEAEWSSIVEADSLAALRTVTCPVLIIQGLLPWWDGHPYFTDAIVEAQLRAARASAQHVELFVARRSNHPALIGNPEPELVTAIDQFVRRCGRTAPDPAAAARRPGR